MPVIGFLLSSSDLKYIIYLSTIKPGVIYVTSFENVLSAIRILSCDSKQKELSFRAKYALLNESFGRSEAQIRYLNRNLRSEAKYSCDLKQNPLSEAKFSI